MYKLLTPLLSFLLVSNALAATPAQIRVGTSTLSQRVQMRQAMRMNRSRQTTLRLPSRSPPAPQYPRTPKIKTVVPPSVYTGTPVRGVLQIDQLAAGTTQTVAGSQFVTLISFDTTAGNEDVNLSTLKFQAVQGSLSSAEQFTLFTVSPSGALTKVASAAPSGSTLAFTNIGFVLEQGVRQRFTIQARLRTGNVLAIGFLTTDPLFVQATGLHYGRDLSPGIQVDNVPCSSPSVCRIFVHTRDARSITVQSVGNLYVTVDTTPVTSHQLLLGSKTDTLLRLTFHATDEDVSVTGLAINGGSDTLSELELSVDGSSGVFATATPAQCDTFSSSRFCAQRSSGLFSVPKDGDVHIVVRAIIPSRTDGGISGQTFTLSLTDAATPPVAVKAQGLSSLHQLAQNNGDGTADGEVVIGRSTSGANSIISGSTHDSVAAKLLQIDNASTDADQSLIPYGASTFARFRFTAIPNSNNRSVVLKKVVFTVSATNVVLDTSGLTLVNAADPARTASCTSSGTTGIITVTCASLDTSILGTTIDPGSSLTLMLRGTLSRGTTDGISLLQATLGSLGNRSSPGTIEWTDGISSFTWVDLPVTQVKATLYKS